MLEKSPSGSDSGIESVKLRECSCEVLGFIRRLKWMDGGISFFQVELRIGYLNEAS
jgi:hypothetical protein